MQKVNQLILKSKQERRLKHTAMIYFHVLHEEMHCSIIIVFIFVISLFNVDAKNKVEVTIKKN